MASTVLPNGIIIPEKYSRDWYNDLYHNWQELDNLLGGGGGGGANDGTLTIQKNGTTVGTFSANQSTNETINITVPDVNDATLTIQQNGTTVDTFTANSSTDKTVDITVPTKTSDLTNDSGFITEDTTKIPLAGSNAISGSLIPSTNGTVNLGGSSYQWNNAYIKSLTINGVACGDILTHNVSEFVGVANAQTIGGAKTFIGRLAYKSTGAIAGDSTSGNFAGNFNFTDKNGVLLGALGLSVYNNHGYTEQALGIINPAWFNDDTKTKNFGVRLRIIHETEEVSFVPNTNNAINLGSTVFKWKSFNGINPGALSLPNSTNYINVDTTNWDLTCQNGQLGSFTPTADGWLMLHVINSGPSEVNFWIIGGVIGINNKSSISTTDNNNFNMFTIPVEKDVTYNIYGNASEYVAGRSIRYCRFIRCRGNV